MLHTQFFNNCYVMQRFNFFFLLSFGERSEYFRKKFYNFGGCEMIVAVPYPALLSTGVIFDSNGKFVNACGFAVRFFEEIGGVLNYTMSYNPLYLGTREHYNQSLIVDVKILDLPLRYLSFPINFCFTYTFKTNEDLL